MVRLAIDIYSILFLYQMGSSTVLFRQWPLYYIICVGYKTGQQSMLRLYLCDIKQAIFQMQLIEPRTNGNMLNPTMHQYFSN